MAAEMEDNNGWQEAGRSGGGGGATVVRRRRRNSITIRPWRAEVDDGQGVAGWGVHFFLFLAGMNSTFNPTIYNPTINGGYFWDFGGSFLLRLR